jgi:hypothetical protein
MGYERSTGASAAGKWGVVLAAVAGIAGVGYYLVKEQVVSSPKLPQLPTQEVVAPPIVAAQKPVEKPVYEEPEPVPVVEPLPDLNQSDAAVLAALKGLNVGGLVEMIIPDEILRKFVRAVDAAEDGKIVTEYRPIASPQGAFVADSFNVKVSGGEVGEVQEVEQFRVSPKNYLRYTLFVQVIQGLDSDAAAALYKRYYPLLNKAYQELGLNKGNFHSVMIRAIDKLLAAPEANADLLLVRPKVYYEFSDPVLEGLPQVHKLLLRMGPDNAARLKASLKNIRARLVQK